MSKKTLVLDNPVMINGKEVKELTYDPMKITAEQFVQASARCTAKEINKTISLKARESDYAFHFYLGCAAIIAVNPNIDFEDLGRVSGYDTLKIADIGLLFTVRRSEGASEENSSDEQKENTASTSM